MINLPNPLNETFIDAIEFYDKKVEVSVSSSEVSETSNKNNLPYPRLDISKLIKSLEDDTEKLQLVDIGPDVRTYGINYIRENIRLQYQYTIDLLEISIWDDANSRVIDDTFTAIGWSKIPEERINVTQYQKLSDYLRTVCNKLINDLKNPLQDIFDKNFKDK